MMSVTLSSRSSGSSGPRPSNSFLTSSTSRARSLSVSRRASSSRVSPIALVTLAEMSAGSSVSMRETSIASKSRLCTLTLSSRVASTASSRGRHAVAPPRNAPACSTGAWLPVAREILSVSFIVFLPQMRAPSELSNRVTSPGPMRDWGSLATVSRALRRRASSS